MLWLALHSKRMIAAILGTMVIGLAITATVGLLVFGAFNVGRGGLPRSAANVPAL